MAPTSKYTVLHPVLHNAKGYGRGYTIELADEHAEPLLKSKHIQPYVAPVNSTAATLPASALTKLTIPELQDYAKSAGVDLPEGATKDGILAAISAKA